jgi:hypothetical protein
MTVDLAALAKLASEATPGPWANQRQRPLAIVTADQMGLSWGGSSDPDEDRRRFAQPLAVVQLDDLTLRDNPEIAEMFPHRRVNPVIAQADAAYIAAASPDVVAALVRVALAAKAVVKSELGVATGVVRGPDPKPEDFVWSVGGIDTLRAALADLDR